MLNDCMHNYHRETHRTIETCFTYPQRLMVSGIGKNGNLEYITRVISL